MKVRKNMGKKVLSYQSKVGCVLGIVLICAMFMPRYAITSKLGDALVQCTKEYAGTQSGILGSALASDADSYRQMVQQMISKFEQEGIPTKYSGFSVAVSSPMGILEKLGTDDEGISTYLGYWNIVRIYIWVLIAAAIGLLVAAVAEQRKKEYVRQVTLFAWGVAGLNVFYVLAVQFIVAGKLEKMSGDGTAMSVKFARRVLWSLHGSGFTVSMIATVLLAFWLLWRYMSMGKLTGLKDALAKVIDVNKYIGSAEGQNMQTASGDMRTLDDRGEIPPQPPITPHPPIPPQPPIQPQSPKCIYAVRGMFCGATIPCGPNEQISIGREANLCQIVIANPGVDPKHGTISYDYQRNMYLVTCYSNAGIQISGYGNLMAQQSVQVQPGTHLIIAGTEEFELR